MKRWAVRLFVFGAALVFCLPAFSQEQEKIELGEPEAVSLLGEELYALPAGPKEIAGMEESAAQMRQLVVLEPGNTDFLLLYGHSLADLWRFREAVAAYSEAIRYAPDYFLPYRHRGQRYIALRKFDLAEKDLTVAVKKMSNFFENLYYLGVSKYLKGDFSGAAKYLKRALEHALNDDNIVAGAYWLYHCLRHQGKHDEAARLLGTVREDLMLEEVPVYRDLLLFYKGKISEESLLAHAEYDTNKPIIYHGLGCLHLYGGDSAKAHQYFTVARGNRYWPALGYIAAEVELAGRAK